MRVKTAKLVKKVGFQLKIIEFLEVSRPEKYGDINGSPETHQ